MITNHLKIIQIIKIIIILTITLIIILTITLIIILIITLIIILIITLIITLIMIITVIILMVITIMAITRVVIPVEIVSLLKAKEPINKKSTSVGFYFWLKFAFNIQNKVYLYKKNMEVSYVFEKK